MVWTEFQLDQVFRKYGGRCTYCAASITRSAHGEVMRVLGIPTWEVDHWWPVSRTSSVVADNPQNLVPACFNCNREKADMSGEEYARRRWKSGLNVNPALWGFLR